MGWEASAWFRGDTSLPGGPQRQDGLIGTVGTPHPLSVQPWLCSCRCHRLMSSLKDKVVGPLWLSDVSENRDDLHDLHVSLGGASGDNWHSQHNP